MIPADANLEPLARWLAGYLYTYAKGKPLALKWEVLLDRARAFYSLSTSYMRLREAKEYCFEHPLSIFEMAPRIHPICSGSEGIWYAGTNEEGRTSAAYLREKGMDLLKKASILEGAVDDLYTRQGEMF